MAWKYHWEQRIDGEWQRVDASALPSWLKKKKAVLFASQGMEYHRGDATGTEQSYRMVKTRS